MIVVIIAGGSGTRLWPLSTPEYPKHLLALAGERTLLQTTFDRVANIASPQQVLVVSEQSHAHFVQEQLPHLPPENVLVEPARRGTGNCLAFALQAIKARGWSPDEPIAVFWADHVINDQTGFSKTIQAAAAVSSEVKKIVDIGIHPTYPSTGFGYIKRGAVLTSFDEAYELSAYQEKPDLATAEQYIAEGGYYWNTGYLVAPLSVFERDMQKYSPQLWSNYQTLVAATNIEDVYRSLEDANLERNLNENDPDMIVIPSDFDWIDIGSHGDLHDISRQDSNGNTVVGKQIELEQTGHAYVRNETTLPVAVIGVKDIIVIVTDNGVLVANKSDAQKVGEVSKRFTKL